MEIGSRTVAIVPMRGGSERVPGKNLRPLAGVPLFHHVVLSLLAVPQVDEVVIDTDSPAIIADAAREFPGIRVLRRPDHLGQGHVSMNDVLRNTLRQVNCDLVLQVHSTSPFLSPGTLSRAIRSLNEGAEHDSAFGVTRFHARFWDHEGRPLNHDPRVLLRTQDLPPVFLENSAFFLFTPRQLQDTGNRIGLRPLMVEVDPLEAIDIDVESDFLLAEALMSANAKRSE